MSTNDHPDQETERTQLRVRHRELQPQVGRRGDLSGHRLRRCCVARLHPHQERDLFRATSVNRPETSSSPSHDVSTNVAYGQPQVCSARGLAASPAMGEGTTRDHFAREAAAVITSAKGDTEAATRPTPEHDGTRDRRLPALRHPPAHRSHHHRSPGPATDARGNHPAASPRTAGNQRACSVTARRPDTTGRRGGLDR